jgi:hypothetical protein
MGCENLVDLYLKVMNLRAFQRDAEKMGQFNPAVTDRLDRYIREIEDCVVGLLPVRELELIKEIENKITGKGKG